MELLAISEDPRQILIGLQPIEENFDSLVKSLFEMSPGVRRWSGAEEATGCRLLASPPYLLRSGQA